MKYIFLRQFNFRKTLSKKFHSVRDNLGIKEMSKDVEIELSKKIGTQWTMIENYITKLTTTEMIFWERKRKLKQATFR